MANKRNFSKKKAVPQVVAPIPEGYRLVPELKSERAQFLLKPSIKEGIQALAATQGLSMNELVNRILEEYLE